MSPFLLPRLSRIPAHHSSAPWSLQQPHCSTAWHSSLPFRMPTLLLCLCNPAVLLAGTELAPAGQPWGSVRVARPPWPHTVTVGHTATCLFTVWTSGTLNYSNLSSLRSSRYFLEAVGTLMPCETHFYLELGTWDEDLLPKTLCKSCFMRKQQ